MVYALALIGNLLLAAVASATPTYGPYTGNNWAGSVLQSTQYAAISGQFAVPKIAYPQPQTSGLAGAAAWVGIDGYKTCLSADFQAGVSLDIVNGVISYNGFYQWYPNAPVFFTSLTIAAGDTILVNVTTTSPTTGTAVVQNLSNGQTGSVTLSVPKNPLCRLSAEWIVGSYANTSAAVPLANFGDVDFLNSVATTVSGTTQGPVAGTIFNIVAPATGQVLTQTTPTANSVNIQYIGP
ncbi:hypothetical protein FRB94_002984 [Tulasnella sp. JGI-2019a]|nr:hypothetical protein FRB94_002984 [Tulasnella sp. JGI-2019a]